MPLFEYGCRACGERFERLRRYEERLSATACPACGAEETSLRLSAPGHVGTAAAGPADACATRPGGCCGGGACMAGAA